MRRRAVLRAGVSLVGLGVTGRPAAGFGSGTTEAAARTYGPVGRVPVPGAADCRVSAAGDTVYVAVGDGFAAFTVPELEPLAAVRSIVPDRDGGPLGGVADLAVDGDRLLVPGPANRRPGRIAGFALFDVSDPGRPTRVAFHETAFPIHNAALADGYAYLTAEDALVVVDVSDDDPVAAGRWSLADVDPRWTDVAGPLWVLHDVRVRGDLGVLSQWDAGTWLVDVGTPDDVTVLGRVGGRPSDALAEVPTGTVHEESIALPGNHHSAALSADGTLLAIGKEAFRVDGTGGPGGIDLFDIADPSAPSHLATIEAPRAADETLTGTWTTAHDFAFEGRRLLSAWYQGGVRVHDVSDPTAPRELAWWRRPREAAFWTAQPAAGDTFVATSTGLPSPGLQEALFLFPNRPGTQADPPSLTDPSTPTESPGSTPSTTPSPTRTRTPGQPGLGWLAAAGGLSGLAWWRHRRAA